MRFALLLIALGSAWAAANPDFSGTWKLDPERSRAESATEPKNLVLEIEQQGPKITLTYIDHKGEKGDTMTLATDGTAQNVTIDGEPATATARWDDQHLVIEWTRNTPQGQVRETRRMKLGDTGKMMTGIYTVKDKEGERTAYGFYVKE